jgi:aminoglycoside phosphotransferase family enzyme
LRLNRRLAAWVYLDVVALTVTADGAFELGGDGRAADWLVKMVRLPEAEMMDNLIRSGRFGEAECERIAGHLARFYAGLTPERLTPEAYVSRLLAEADEQQRHFAGIDDAIATQPWQAALDDQRRYIRTRPGPIGERAAAGRIVEAHGDLRPQHVYLGSRFAVIDCLEFSRDLRIQDSAEEIAFLALECQRVGDRELRDLLLEVWQATSGDPPDASLLSFYLSRRAIVRAILSAWHLDDPHFDRQHYIEETEHYVGLARQFIREALSAAER